MAGTGSYAYVGGAVNFGASGAGASHIMASNGGVVSLSATYYIFGDASSHIQAAQAGQVLFMEGAAETGLLQVAGLAFTQFLAASALGSVSIPTNWTFGGNNAAGLSYNVSLNALASWAGRSGNAVFGFMSTPGVVSSGGQVDQA